VNLADVLRASADRYADRPVVTDVASARCLTYAELAREAERVSAFLAAHGVGRHQRVGLRAENGLGYLPAAFGILAAGACLTPIAGHLTPAETAELIQDVDLNAWLGFPEAGAPADDARGAPVLRGGACAGFALRDTGEAAGPVEFRELDPAFIRFTSGTTGASKGVVLSHDATLARVDAADRVLRFGPDDRILWVLPLAYHFAVTIVAYVRAGAHILMCPDARPAAMLDAIHRLRPTVLYASPLHFDRLGRLESRGRLESVRVALSTSAPLASAVRERFESQHGLPLGQAYGIIEAGLPCINPGGAGRAESLGRPVPGYEVTILSGAGPHPGPDGTGEIAVRGPGLFSAYYRPWRRRDDLLVGGWFPTGDVGWLDEDGALHLSGRKKAVILVAGLKVFPEEVEACIDRFPGVAASRVFARSHERLGEVPCAQIVPEPDGGDLDLESLAAHCARLLSPHKVPVEFTPVDAIARTSGGKVLRRLAPGATR